MRQPPLAIASLAIAFAACAGPAPIATLSLAGSFDILIENGLVVDGTGAKPQSETDVLIRGDRIVFVGDVDPTRVAVALRIDARGKVVAPGFIDAHAHGDPMRAGRFRNFLAMGVTTICLGMDGASPTRGSFDAWLTAVSKRDLGPNVAAFVGHGTARIRSGVGNGPGDSPKAAASIAAEVRVALDCGAFGMTTGLEYTPGRFAGQRELALAAQPVAQAGGLVMSHVRNEDDAALHDSLRELLAQCQTAGCPAHVSHLKVVYGRGAKRAAAALAVLDRARELGQRVTADVYPYTASYTGIGIVFPAWAQPPADYDVIRRERRDELADYLRQRISLRNGPGATVFGDGRFAGQSLAAVADRLGKPFEDVLIDDVGPTGTSAAYFVMDEATMRRLLLAPYVMVASDGSPTMRHPRGHGTFARVLAKFVRNERLLSLQAAIRKMTSLPADTVGLVGRGRLAVGMFADLVVFDFEQVEDTATFEDPYQLAVGFEQVLVNGEFAIRDGAFTKAHSGRGLRRTR